MYNVYGTCRRHMIETSDHSTLPLTVLVLTVVTAVTMPFCLSESLCSSFLMACLVLCCQVALTVIRTVHSALLVTCLLIDIR